VNEGEFTTLKDGHVAEDLGELFIVTDRQLEVAGGVSEFLVCHLCSAGDKRVAKSKGVSSSDTVPDSD
jgi:hypothetical protein